MFSPTQGNSKSLRWGVYITFLMGNLSPLRKVILSLADETVSPSGEALDLPGRTSIKPSVENVSLDKESLLPIV